MEENQEIRMVLPELEHQLSSNRTQDQTEGLDQRTPGMAAAVEVILCLLSMVVSNISCLALVTFFLTTLPAKRNLLTFFDILLVVALTCVVDIVVITTLF